MKQMDIKWQEWKGSEDGRESEKYISVASF
jgi:hypothetical protein